MSTRVIDGAYTTLVSNIPNNVTARFGAIGVVGNFTSGVKYDSAGVATLGSGTPAGSTGAGDFTGWQTYDGNGNGFVYQFDSYDQVVKRFDFSFIMSNEFTLDQRSAQNFTTIYYSPSFFITGST